MASRRKATAEMLRNDIDSGRTGDKVAAPDPTAAPLGTDEEAAGVQTDPEVLAETRRRELRAGSRPEPRQRGTLRLGGALLVVAAIAALLFIVFSVSFPDG